MRLQHITAGPKGPRHGDAYGVRSLACQEKLWRLYRAEWWVYSVPPGLFGACLVLSSSAGIDALSELIA